MRAAIVQPLNRRFEQLVEGLSPTYWFLWSGMLLNRAGSFVVPMMTVYLTTQRHLSLVEAGSVVALFGLGSMVGTTVGGVLSDRLGRRATLLLALTSGAVMMLNLSRAQSIPELSVSVFLLGSALDMFRPAVFSMVADVVESEHRLKAFGTLYWAVNLGFAFATSIGGLAAAEHFSLLFMLDAASMLGFALIVWAKVPETRPQWPAGHDEGSLLAPFLDKRYLPFMALNLLTAMIFFQFLTTLPDDVRQKGLGASDYGFAIATNGVLIVLIQPFATAWASRRPRATVLALGTAFTGLGFGLTAFASTLPAYVGTVIVWTIGEVLMSPVNSSLVADLSPKGMRGRYQGAFGLTWSVAMMLSSSLSPRYAQHVGSSGLWATCAGLGLVVAAAHLWVTARLVRPEPS
jgi:MFS family permease